MFFFHPTLLRCDAPQGWDLGWFFMTRREKRLWHGAYLGASWSWTRPLWNGARGHRTGRDFRAGHSEPTEKSRPTDWLRRPGWKPRPLRSCAGACPSASEDVPDGCWTILAHELPSVWSWKEISATYGFIFTSLFHKSWKCVYLDVRHDYKIQYIIITLIWNLHLKKDECFRRLKGTHHDSQKQKRLRHLRKICYFTWSIVYLIWIT